MNPYHTGDPVTDLAQGRPMIVLDAPNTTVAEWSEQNGYELTENYANAKLDATPGECVVRCAYVSDIRSEPSKDYTFPVSRVRLIDVHHADDGMRVRDRIAVEVLADVFRALAPREVETDVLEREYGADVVDVARELASVDELVPEASSDE